MNFSIEHSLFPTHPPNQQRVEGEGGSLGRAAVVVDGPAAIIALSAGAASGEDAKLPPAPVVDISSNPDVRIDFLDIA